MEARIGIVGVGHLAGYLVEGWCRAGHAASLLLSPRNRETAAALAERFDVRVAADSQGVVDDADVVLLSVPPGRTAATAAELRFREGQVVVSAAAAVPLASLVEACAPAAVVRAMPMTATALGESPIPLHPGHATAEAALAPLGRVHVMEGEAEFEAASVMAMHYGWVLGVMAEAGGWLAAQGVAPDKAFALAADATRAAACIALDRGTALPGEVAGITRPGSYTGLGWRRLRHRGVPEAWREACEKVLEASRRPAG